ncbi:MAG: aminopeptidase P N-terminal domain-containing protein [Gemmatimonadota bacterium]
MSARREFLRSSGALALGAALTPGLVRAVGPAGIGRGRPHHPGAAPAGLDFAPSEYAARREKLMDRIPDGIAIILGSIAGPMRNEFIQNNDFIYLCGVKLPRAVLIIDGMRRKTTLLYTVRENYLRNEGLSIEYFTDPAGFTGIDEHLPIDQLTPVLTALADRTRVFHTPLTPEGPPQEVSTENDWDGRLTRERQFVRMIQQRLPQVEVRDCTQAIWELRRIKTPAEIDVLRTASRITADGMIEVMKNARVGQYEYELSALFEYVCKRQGCRRVFDYNVIIASAENHPYLHYYRHDRQLVDGDFLVVDTGADYRDYDSDTAISFPINGRFSPRQREMYEACNAVSKACLPLYRPGITGYEMGELARQQLAAAGHDLSRDVFTRLRYFKEGGVTHHVGLATHDAGGSDKPKDEPLRAGEVIACDVFATYPDEDLGVRIESIVLVTETGSENFSAGVPREIAEIEALMRS